MPDEDALDEQRRMWTVGDYPTIARLLLPISVDTVASLAPGAGDLVLDVGVGDGNAAIEAARCGAVVTGIDLTPKQIERARSRCAEAGADVELLVADAQDLPFDDAGFDVVLSIMGVIFAPDHRLALTEMRRVCRPGGVVTMTAWAHDGWPNAWGPRLGGLLGLPPRTGRFPEEWGDPGEIRRRFSAAGMDAVVEPHDFAFRFPSVDVAVEVFTANAGPLIEITAAAVAAGRAAETHDALIELTHEWNVGASGECVLPAPYLTATARRPA